MAVFLPFSIPQLVKHPTLLCTSGIEKVLYSPRNDPDPEMIPTFHLVDPEMIPKE